jgi:plasmid stabilization system protein ParE
LRHLGHIRVSVRATAQIEKAHKWWQLNRLSAPNAVVDDIKIAFDVLKLQPECGTTIVSATAKGVRRMHLDRISYYLYYRLTNLGEVVVIAFWHTSRGKQPKI